jgi:EmrB/QacA subfamily drug resistance transporter
MSNAIAAPTAPPRPLPTATAAEDASRRWLVFAVIAVGVFMAQLDLFIVNIAFPAIEHDFPGSSNGSLSWVLNVYAVVFAACLVPAGRLGDLLGRRRTFQLGLLVFALGSAGCAAAPSLEVLVAARALQAVGAALLVPTSLGLLLHAFPASQRAGAMGAWASAGAVAAASGAPLGGVLVQASWRLIFLVNLPLALGALIASRRWLVEVRHPESGGLPDMLGIALLVAGIGGLVLCIVDGADWGWGSASFLGGVLAALALLAMFLRRCATHAAPVVELSLLTLRPFAAANAVMLMFFAAFGAMLLVSVLFLTGPWGYSTLTAGLMIAPGPLVVTGVALNAKRIVPHLGARAVVATGSVLLAAGGAWWVWRLGAKPDYVTAFLPGLILAALGIGVVQATIFSVAAGVLPDHRFATGSGVLNMSRQIGLALGVAILVALLGGAPTVADFHRGVGVMVAGGLLAALAAALLPGRAGQRRASRLRRAATAAVSHDLTEIPIERHP